MEQPGAADSRLLASLEGIAFAKRVPGLAGERAGISEVSADEVVAIIIDYRREYPHGFGAGSDQGPAERM